MGLLVGVVSSVRNRWGCIRWGGRRCTNLVRSLFEGVERKPWRFEGGRTGREELIKSG